MIVIGLDVRKRSVTAVAVDEAGRALAERTISVGSDELLGWASELNSGRLWAVEDCRQLTRRLERRLLGVGEELVRVPPKLAVPERRAGRSSSLLNSSFMKLHSTSSGASFAAVTTRRV